MGGGTGRLPERDIKWDLAMHVYISYLSRSVYMERISSRQSGTPVRSTRTPAKAGQFLSYKHSVPLCRNDIMLTLQIVLGRNILM